MAQEPKELKSGNLVQKRGQPARVGIVVGVRADKTVLVEWNDSMNVLPEEKDTLERVLRQGEIL